MRWLEGIIDSMDRRLSQFQETVKDGETWVAAVHGFTESDRAEGLNNNDKIRGVEAQHTP